MIPLSTKAVHKSNPPCHCDKCLQQTAVADQHRSRVLAVLATIAQCDRRHGGRRYE